MSESTCHFCGESGARLNVCHWTGTEYVRVNVCQTGTCRDQLASAPRRPRRKRQAVIVDAGGWAPSPA